MNKKLSSIILLLSINIYSQNIKVEWFKNKLDPKIEILGNLGNETIGILKENTSISYVKISNNGEVSKKEKLPFKFDNIKYSYVNTILTKTSIIVLIKENREKELLEEEKEKLKKIEDEKKKGITKEYDEKLKLNNIRKKIGPKNKEGLKKLNDSIREDRMKKIEKEKMEKIMKEKELLLGINIGKNLNVNTKPIRIKGITIKEKIKNYGLYSFSNDSSKILIYNKFQTTSTEQIKFSFTIINENLNDKEKDTIFEVPMLMVSPEKVKFSKLYLDNNNNILGIFKEIRSIENNNSNFFFKTLIFDNQTFKPRAFNIDYDGDIIDNLEIFPQDNNKFYLVGFLAGIKKGLKFAGKASVRKNNIFLSEINSELKTFNKIFYTNVDALYPYNNSKITNYMPYLAEDIYVNNNEYTIIAHQINKKTKTNTINPGEEIDYDNSNIQYGDISMIKINKKGVLTYSGSISKFQSPNNKNPLMLFSYQNENLITIFEDAVINKEVDLDMDPWNTIKFNETKEIEKALFYATLNKNTKLIKEIINDYKKDKKIINFKNSFKIDNKTFLILSTNNDIGKLTIN